MMHACLGGQNFTINETRFKAGRHHLVITISGSAVSVGPRAPPESHRIQFDIRRKHKLILCQGSRDACKKNIVAIIPV